MKIWISKNLFLVAFLILALVGGLAIQRSANAGALKLWHAQLASCQRGNSLRIESNNRIQSHTLDRDVLQAFLRSQAESMEKNNKEQSLRYLDLAEELNDVQFHSSAIVNCQHAFPKP